MNLNLGLDLTKFNTTRELDTNLTHFWRVWVEYNRVYVKFVFDPYNLFNKYVIFMLIYIPRN